MTLCTENPVFNSVFLSNRYRQRDGYVSRQRDRQRETEGNIEIETYR